MKKLPKLPPVPKLEDDIVYLDDNFNIVPKKEATLIKIIRDGEVIFAKPYKKEIKLINV